MDAGAANSLGFVLQHRYAFESAGELPLSRLRGRDRILAEAFQLSGIGRISVRPYFVRIETGKRILGDFHFLC
jgi:hypothetical protein